ncbi:glycosyl transferase family 2 [Pirellula staleyi DSM 6068]|uniref:Glycosyl transferase family 2 n=1 Tax=Pirellula staleyi (strain ATCC 27377 / DSM 6068 / ICPB 4128) TaxID=530564 RepID=D2QYT6_PIRSD|nr:glycosyltransferase [Pirellula staleyi]ADB16391.1 glycosyl transferase family 2 [Pirellula staleyi DSM 6068]
MQLASDVATQHDAFLEIPVIDYAEGHSPLILIYQLAISILVWSMTREAWIVWGGMSFAWSLMLLAILHFGGRQIRWTKDLPLPTGELPLVSIVVPARNEARGIEGALRSLLAIDYPHYELLVVNDRSTDATGEILSRLALEHPQLQVVNISELPAGWLGKNHALHYGLENARGEYVLFTDADIVHDPTVLRRTVAHMQSSGLDHLTLGPTVEMPSLLLRSFVVMFSVMFTLFTRPWAAANPRSRAYVGIGAYNLVRREALLKIGGLQPLRMRPDDDVMLGRLIKHAGLKQEMQSGVGMISVEWYATLWEVVVGLEKNCFAAMNYSIIGVIIGTATLINTFCWPFVACFTSHGEGRWLFIASAVTIYAIAIAAARSLKRPPIEALLFPFCVLMFVFINYRSMFLTLWQGGIKWRDTLYPLRELRANRL